MARTVHTYCWGHYLPSKDTCWNSIIGCRLLLPACLSICLSLLSISCVLVRRPGRLCVYLFVCMFTCSIIHLYFDQKYTCLAFCLPVISLPSGIQASSTCLLGYITSTCLVFCLPVRIYFYLSDYGYLRACSSSTILVCKT